MVKIDTFFKFWAPIFGEENEISALFGVFYDSKILTDFFEWKFLIFSHVLSDRFSWVLSSRNFQFFFWCNKSKIWISAGFLEKCIVLWFLIHKKIFSVFNVKPAKCLNQHIKRLEHSYFNILAPSNTFYNVKWNNLYF